MYNLFLDDERFPSTLVNPGFPIIHEKKRHIYADFPWIIARSYADFVFYLNTMGMPDKISFDHDLADEHYLLVSSKYTKWNEYYASQDREMTGYDCAKYLVDFCISNNKKLPECYIHTLNSVGRANIQSLFKNFENGRHNNVQQHILPDAE